MRVKEIKSAKASDNGVIIVADIEWRTGKVGIAMTYWSAKPHATVSKVDGVTQVDFHRTNRRTRSHIGRRSATCRLSFPRAYRGGRQGHEIHQLPLGTPGKVAGNGKILSKEWKWNRLQFQLGGNWYSATQFNSPNQPVEELSGVTTVGSASSSKRISSKARPEARLPLPHFAQRTAGTREFPRRSQGSGNPLARRRSKAYGEFVKSLSNSLAPSKFNQSK